MGEHRARVLASMDGIDAIVETTGGNGDGAAGGETPAAEGDAGEPESGEPGEEEEGREDQEELDQVIRAEFEEERAVLIQGPSELEPPDLDEAGREEEPAEETPS
jgi:hypothetical protein